MSKAGIQLCIVYAILNKRWSLLGKTVVGGSASIILLSLSSLAGAYGR